MNENVQLREGEIILYASPDGMAKVEVSFLDETFWLTQKRMADLFGADVRTISEHLQGIFDSGELPRDAVIRKFRTTAADGKSYLTNHYNLDAIIAVGYRVNSRQATQFRIWATRTLREFLIAFLRFNEYEVLTSTGTISHAVAVELAEERYERFRVRQDRDYESDFEREVKRLSDRQETEP